MKEFADQLFNALLEEIDLFNEMGIAPVKKVAGVINAVRKSLAGLRAGCIENPPPGQAEEIELFKYLKPKFVAEQIFALEAFTIDNAKPLGDELLQKSYYEQELKYVRRFFDQHRFMYQYYLLDGAELDALYFVRGVQVPAGLLPEGLEPDPEFSTSGDYLFARFLAYERLQEYLLNCLCNRAENKLPGAQVNRRPFFWTGDKSNLVELAYGIFGTLQINDGEVTIAEIVGWLEESFQISLSRYYRRFSEIKMRKSVSRSRYLDEMRAAFLRYIDEGDAFKPLPERNAPAGKREK